MGCDICTQADADMAQWEIELMGCTCSDIQPLDRAVSQPIVPVVSPPAAPLAKSSRPRRGRGGVVSAPPKKARRLRRDPWPLQESGLPVGDDVADWERFDAVALFDETPRLHTNKVTYTDEEQAVSPGDSSEELNFGHEDELTVEVGAPEAGGDERELEADSTEGEPPLPAASNETDEDGAGDPIQKDPEGVEEVAEATSKTSEDVHGGDEATKDIEDSPNAANDGQDPNNQGAEAGKDGEGDDGESQDGEGEPGESGEPGAGIGGGLEPEGWEASADHPVSSSVLTDLLEEIRVKDRDEEGHRATAPTYQFDREGTPAELEVAFKKGRELVRKLVTEESLTERIAGSARWDVQQLARMAVSYRHPRISSARFDRPKEADIVIVLDISGSCEQQAEMFMAIAAGAIGNGVRIYVGYNGSVRCRPLEPPRRPLRSYAQAKVWAQSEVAKTAGWDNAGLGEWSFGQFVEAVQPKTCIIFGDWDGKDQYQAVCHLSKHRSIRFFWFANEGISRGRCTLSTDTPRGWGKKNYFPAVYRPQDLVTALRKVR